MASFGWKFCTVCVFYLLFVCLICSEATVKEDPYYRYQTQVPPGHPVYDVINSELKDTMFLDNVRSKRNVKGDTSGLPASDYEHMKKFSLIPNNNSPDAINTNANISKPTTTRINERILQSNVGPNSTTATAVASIEPDIGVHQTNNGSSKIASNTQVPNNKVPLPNAHIVSAGFDPSTATSSNILKDKDDDDFFKDFSQELTNVTYTVNNITRIYKDSHIYYNSSLDSDLGQQYWIDMDSKNNVTIHEMLSQSHRRAATVKLSFDFPFYGHTVRNVTIATGGFLFTGDHIHTWLAATQYIAPLMANFDTRMSDSSFVKYMDNGTAFTVLWENVLLKDTPEFGTFTFEVTLHKSGDIVFVYKNIPIVVENIKDDHHPVKIGLSDAYVIDRTIFFVKRKTIYEYHRVNFNKEDIKNWTVIYLTALPTCLDLKDCDSCLHSNINLEITGDYADTRKCNWCPAVNRCSTGLDRLRQEWLAHDCDKLFATQCNEPPPPPYAHQAEPNDIGVKSSAKHQSTNGVQLGISSIVSSLLLVTSLAATALLLMYAYRNPHSTPGQLLIRYRPSQWRWRRGEARYTAATIHM